MADRPLPPEPDRAFQKALLDLMLAHSEIVKLLLRPVPGTKLPEDLLKADQLVVDLGLDLPVPIPDLRCDEEGVYGTLSFSRAPFESFIPWSAVRALATNSALVQFPAAEYEQSEGAPAPQETPRAKLSLVPSSNDESDAS